MSSAELSKPSVRRSSCGSLSEEILKSPRASRPTSLLSWTNLLIGILALCVLTAFAAILELRAEFWTTRWRGATETGQPVARNPTLVLYIFSNTDPQYLNNLKFFLREGVHANDRCEYVFVVNQNAKDVVSSDFTYCVPSTCCLSLPP
jgi:hypothetical protein